MDCPRCGKPLTDRNPRGPRVYACEGCGWGEERLSSRGGAPWEAAEEPPPPRPTAGKVALLWVLSVVVIVGPLIVLTYGVPYLAATRGVVGATTPAEVWGWLHPYYWLGIAVYVVLAATVSPSYDAGNLWWGGIPGLNNPFSLQDDWNRTMRGLALALLPGKLVVLCLQLSWRFLRPPRGNS